jgi:ElaB/YqjD/DUF883 family membrane-anchored ribosome-binding protein
MNKNGMTDVGQTNQGTGERIDSIKDTMKGLVDQGAQKVDAIKSKVVEAKDQAFTRGNDLLDRMTDIIKAHPIASVGIAFGAGYFGMRLFRR